MGQAGQAPRADRDRHPRRIAGLAEPHPSHQGRVLGGRYELLEVVGQGSFGRVYRATDLVTGETLAVKEFLRTVGRKDGFLRELGLLFDLRHPAIVRCETLLMEQGLRYLAFEYLGGGSLRDYLASPGFDVNDGLRLLEQAATGVAHAHAHGIIHRDLKPENILLAREAGQLRAKVTDFGVAVLGRSSATHEGIGSPAYMAPEQFYDDYDERVDIYALGIMAYELLTGSRPFIGGAEEVMQAQIQQDPMIPFWIPDGCRQLIERALAKDPDGRYATVNDFVADLRAARVTEGRCLEGAGWPTTVGQATGLWTTPDWVLALVNEQLHRFDRRGRLVELMGRVRSVDTSGNHYVVHQDGRWIVRTPVSRRVVTGVPAYARVRLSAESALIYTADGCAMVVRGRDSIELMPEGAGVTDVAFYGPDQSPAMAVVDATGPHLLLDYARRRVALPCEPVRLLGHPEAELLLVELDTNTERWLIVRGVETERRELPAVPLCCDGKNFLGVDDEGALVSTNLLENRVARTNIGEVQLVAACERHLAWLDRDGKLHASD